MDSIKAVLFDVDNTLIDFNKSSFIAVKSAFAQFNLPFDERTFKVFIESNDYLWSMIEKGQLTREQMFKLRFKRVLEKLSLSGDVDGLELAFRKALYDVAVPIDGAREILEYLSEKYTLYTASNAIYVQHIHRLDLAGLKGYFTDFFTSEKFGYQKPSKQFFDCCFSSMKFSPVQTVMIGDSLCADIGGGKDYGLKTIWFNYAKKEFADNIKADFIVDKLCQIRKIL